MTCKMVILAVRDDEEFTHDECIDYMHEEHAPLVNDLPNLQQYTSSLPANPEYVEYDYIAQLRFEGPEEMDEAFSSEQGEAVQDDAASFLDMEASEMISTVGETVHFEAE